MIADDKALRELAEELAELSLEARRSYIADIESASGKEAANQLRNALTAYWKVKE